MAALPGLVIILLLTVVQLILGQVNVEVTPRDALVKEGDSLVILCRVSVPISSCLITIPGLPGALNLVPSGAKTQGYSYYGEGLQQGQCGVSIERITAQNLGNVSCQLGTTPYGSQGFTRIIVAKPPNIPEMETSPGSQGRNVYRANDVIQAKCSVTDGRPAANISWFIDEERIIEGLSEPIIYEMPDPTGGTVGLATITQNITRHLRPSDNGRMLRCRAEHSALPQGQQTIDHPLNVEYVPQPLSRPVEIFGVVLGETAQINVTIEANPRPTLEWIVSSESIPEGSVSRSGRFEARSAQQLPDRRNSYNATLTIADLTLADTIPEYRLRATNDHGLQEYVIKISQSTQPPGGSLDIGAIVGIVVAVAVVLIVVILIVFARATGRWCFGEKSETASEKHVGETSDTESADYGTQERRKRKLHFRNIFTKPTFKKHADVIDEEVRDEESRPVEQEEEEESRPVHVEGGESPKPAESLVYAELELKSIDGATRPTVRPEQDKTEYAEIVYVSPKKD